MKKLVYIGLILVLATSLCLTAWGAEQPQYGNVLVRIQTGSPKCIGYPPELSGTDFVPATPALDTLVRFDEMGRPTPFLTTAWEVAPDKKSIKFTLRKGVKFHDGTDFNAQAVKFNIEATKVKNPQLASISSVDIIDDSTIRFNLTKFSNTLFNNLAAAAGMMASPTAIQKNGADWARLNPVGTGPFKFKSFQRDVKLEYVKNEDYWDKGKPYLDGITFRFFADITVGQMAFEAGEGHIFVAEPKEAADLQAKGFVVANPGYRGGLVALAPDSKNPDSIFANKKVREAMEYAIDKESIIKLVGYGFWETCNQPSPRDKAAYHPDIKGRPYDLNKAKQLLAEAGYPNGFETRIIYTPSLQLPDSITAVKWYLDKAGIIARLDNADYTRWSSIKNEGWKNSLLSMFLGTDSNYCQTLERHLISTGREYTSTSRPIGWDDFLNQGIAATDFNIQKSALQEMMKLSVDEAMITPLWATSRLNVVSPKLHDHNINRWHHTLWTPADAWLSK